LAAPRRTSIQISRQQIKGHHGPIIRTDIQYLSHFYIQIQNESIQAILKIGNRPVGGPECDFCILGGSEIFQEQIIKGHQGG